MRNLFFAIVLLASLSSCVETPDSGQWIGTATVEEDNHVIRTCEHFHLNINRTERFIQFENQSVNCGEMNIFSEPRFFDLYGDRVYENGINIGTAQLDGKVNLQTFHSAFHTPIFIQWERKGDYLQYTHEYWWRGSLYRLSGVLRRSPF